MSMGLRRWAEAPVGLDYVVAAALAVLALAFSYVDENGAEAFAGSVLHDGGRWSGTMAAFAGVGASLLGFGATVVAVLLVLGGGRRGQRVMLKAGLDLRRLVASCLCGAGAAALVLAAASAINPDSNPRLYGACAIALGTFLALRIARLGVLLLRLLDVVLLDAASPEPSRHPEDEHRA